MLHPLVDRYDLTGDEAALELAVGLANHLLGVSKYFNYKMEFFGHVHSAVWVAAGLVRLGRLLKEERYIDKGRTIFEYVHSLSSDFGWVPEYAQWFPPEGVYCETCCIKDMIECGVELIDAGYPEYYDLIGRYVRNQLVENQIVTTNWLAVDNSREDTEAATWHELDQRIVGGFSGGANPSSISLKRFRSIAGCCVGTGPQALQIAWDRTMTYKRGRLTVNLPISRTGRYGTLSVGYPNHGRMEVVPARAAVVAIRRHAWMPRRIEASVDGRAVKVEERDGLILFPKVRKGATVMIEHALRTVTRKETVQGKTYTVRWRGPDVVDIRPGGEGIRLYQRDTTKRKYYPPKVKPSSDCPIIAVPTKGK